MGVKISSRSILVGIKEYLLMTFGMFCYAFGWLMCVLPAGGMGGAFYAFLHATLKKGIDMVLDAIDFDTTIQGADLVITGEGKVDFQTAKGKTAAGVLARAKKQHIPVIAIGGCVEMCDSLVQMGFAGIYPILEEKVPLEVAMQRDFAMSNVTKTVARVSSR